jgi:hypothetical protein
VAPHTIVAAISVVTPLLVAPNAKAAPKLPITVGTAIDTPCACRREKPDANAAINVTGGSAASRVDAPRLSLVHIRAVSVILSLPFVSFEDLSFRRAGSSHKRQHAQAHCRAAMAQDERHQKADHSRNRDIFAFDQTP